ncbi:MAG: serine O-acetyltransferase [Symbiobacteriia bacterium]
MLRQVRKDIQAVLERDPAVKGVWEVILCYPGFHAIVLHRLNHWLYLRRWFVTARFLSQVVRFFTGIEIHPGARLGNGIFIDHGMGVVIGETAEVGDNCTLYQGVTLGGTGKERGKRHPTLGSNVMVATGAKVLGNISIGDNAKVGAGAVVVKSVPENCTVVGVPGRIVVRDGQRLAEPDLDQVNLPDPQADALSALGREMLRLEQRLHQVEAELGTRGSRKRDPLNVT